MAKPTPLYRQYLEIKKQHPDAILFFRLGDFYETFDEDARIAARELDLVLTGRQLTAGGDERNPMAGVPHHAVEGYIARLIEKGYRVAICEQVGEPVGGLMPREVTRVVTPGTVVEPGLLEDKRNNYLAALVVDRDHAGIAYVDITTGEFRATQVDGEGAETLVRHELERIGPAECLIPETDEGPAITLSPDDISTSRQVFVTPYAGWHFDLETARRSLLDHFGVASLAGYGCADRPWAVRAAGAIIQYLGETRISGLAQVTGLSTYTLGSFMSLDAATRRNLELTESIRSRSTRGALLHVLDATVTAMGGRLLHAWLSQPLLSVEALNRRLDAVEAFTQNTPVRMEIIGHLKKLSDLERLTNRVLAGMAGPRNLAGLRASLEGVPAIVAALGKVEHLPEALAELTLDPCVEVSDLIRQAIVEDPPATLNKPGVIARSYSQELDSIVEASRDAREWIAGLERRERERTGIKSLKVGFNKVFGYYIEVTKPNLGAVPEDYHRKQTLVNSERFITPELKEYEARVLNAEERILELEARLFREVCQEIGRHSERLLGTARALARLDVYTALAEVALRRNYVRPVLTEDGRLDIRAGRHPVVEALAGDRRGALAEPFVPNDARMEPGEIIILTGPNMSGKCVSGDTLVFTDQGLMSIRNLMPNGAAVGEFTQIDCQVRGLIGRKKATHFYRGGRVATVKVTTRLGYQLEGTPEHRVWMRHPDGSESWKRLGDIDEGDVVAIERQIDLWGDETAIDCSAAHSLRNVKRYRLPENLDEDLAYIMGLLVGDGTLTYSNSIMLSTADDFIAEEYRRIVHKLFGYHVGCKSNGRDYFITSKQIRVFLASLGLGHHRAHEKHVPLSILKAPRSVVVAFLQGLFDSDGFVENRYGNVRLSTASIRLAREVQLLLLNLGIIASLRVKKTPARPSYRLSINGTDAIAFHEQVGFRSPRKRARRELDYCHQSAVECGELEAMQTKRYFYDYVEVIEFSEAEVFDLSVVDDHAYVANGFVSHNSTFLRQVAIIVLMAQIGSFVPADEATIGIVDRIFTRIGAQDEIAAGQSTFMVEMIETANILNNATGRSLIILDEIGRGTSTYDGISIAWAVVEHIHNHPQLRAKTLFATHYHELTELAERLPRVRNYNVAVAEEGDQVVFLHRIVPGGADRSYGIHVAELAGLPRTVVRRARQILGDLEAEARAPDALVHKIDQDLGTQLPLFATRSAVDGRLAELAKALRELDVAELTPLEAINKLYELQQEATVISDQ
jgi:DNA mismatch repair protein MutS